MNRNKVLRLAASVGDFTLEGYLDNGEGRWSYIFNEEQLLKFAQLVMAECLTCGGVGLVNMDGYQDDICPDCQGSGDKNG